MTKRTYTRAFATARFGSPELDPLTITQRLLLPPTNQHRNSEPRLVRTKSGKVEARTPYHEGQWSMTSEHWVDSPRLQTHILWLLEQLEPHEASIADILTGDVIADFFCFSCGSTPDPPAIPTALRDRAASLGFAIEIDHYDTTNDTDGGSPGTTTTD